MTGRKDHLDEAVATDGPNLADVRRITIALDNLVDEVLFGSVKWPPDPAALCSRLRDMGLEKAVPGKPLSSRSTKLGQLMDVKLYMAFLGIWDDAEIPSILADYDLFTPEESEWLWDQLEAGVDISNWLQARLQLAFRIHFAQGSLN